MWHIDFTVHRMLNYNKDYNIFSTSSNSAMFLDYLTSNHYLSTSNYPQINSDIIFSQVIFETMIASLLIRQLLA